MQHIDTFAYGNEVIRVYWSDGDNLYHLKHHGFEIGKYAYFSDARDAAFSYIHRAK